MRLFWSRVLLLLGVLPICAVSLFAQEVGTAVPISPKRLDRQLEDLRSP